MDFWSSDYDRLVCITRAQDRSLDRSKARMFARSLARMLDRSLARSLDRSVDRSIARSLDHVHLRVSTSSNFGLMGDELKQF